MLARRETLVIHARYNAMMQGSHDLQACPSGRSNPLQCSNKVPLRRMSRFLLYVTRLIRASEALETLRERRLRMKAEGERPFIYGSVIVSLVFCLSFYPEPRTVASIKYDDTR